MKDSVGSTVLMKIFVVFMVVYIILMASILNYTKTFRIKNQVVNIINRHGGYTTSAESEITDYISKSSIYGKCNLLEGNNEFGSNKEDKCEIKEYQMTDAAGGSYYKVRVYVTFQFPLIKQTLQIPITGETKRLYGAPSTPDNGPKYDIVNRSYNPNNDKADLEIENETCMPGSAPPAAGGCCSESYCLIGEKRYVNGKCGCYSGFFSSGGTPYCSPLKPGTKLSNDNCSCCYTCGAKAELGTPSGEGNANTPTSTASITIPVSDPGTVGMMGCSPYTFNAGTNSVTIEFIEVCKSKVTVSCVDRLGNSSTKTVKVYTKPTNCKSCSGDTCTGCIDGYFLDGNKVCRKCNEGCAKCTKPLVCTECEEGYYKNTIGICKACGTGCSVCTSSTSCTTCDSDHVKAQDNKTCCTPKDNCSTYLANCNCKDCANGYKGDGKGGCKKESTGGGSTTPICNSDQVLCENNTKCCPKTCTGGVPLCVPRGIRAECNHKTWRWECPTNSPTPSTY